MITDSTYHVPVIHASTAAGRQITVTVPGSKSITNRALLLAMLADGTSHLSGILFSDDSRHFLQCLRDLGFTTNICEKTQSGSIAGLGGALPCQEASIQVGSAGTAARFLSAVLGTAHGTFSLDASEQMRKRPMAPLLEALTSLGCNITYNGKEGFFPFTLHADGFQADTITIDIDKSSQFLSALLIAAPLADRDFTIHTTGSHGMAYIRMTIQMMKQFGVSACETQPGTFLVPAFQKYQARSYAIEPDVSAAAYFYALAAITQSSITVRGVHSDSLQGDIQFLDFLKEMGCRYEDTPEGICLTGPQNGILKGITADMSSCSDQAITLAAIAPYAASPVHITGIGHIRHQESDRIEAIRENLTAMGIRCEAGEAALTIYPGRPRPASIHTHDDHRLAMGFSLTGLLSKGICIEDPGCCRKTFENYFETLSEVIAQLNR